MSAPAVVAALCTPTAARRVAWAGLLLGVALRLAAGLGASGIYYDDEVLQFLEPAHRMSSGRGVVTWEYEEGVRSYVLPGMLAGTLRGLDLLGVEHTDVQWRVIRVFLALLSLLGLLAAWRIGELVGGPWVGAGAAWLAAAYTPLLNLAPRVLSDPIAASFSLWGLWLAMRAQRSVAGADSPALAPRPGDAWWAGLFLALGYALRYQAGLAFLPPLAFFAGRRRWAELRALILGAAPIVVLVAIVDAATWGTPWHSALAYVRVNLLEGRAASFGTAPFEAYLVNLAHTFDRLYPLALVLAVLGLRRSGMAGVTFALVFLVHSAIAHKELRFLTGVMPLLMVLLANGTRELLAWLVPRRLWPAAAIAVVLALLLQDAAEVRDQTWNQHAHVHEALAWVQRQPDVTGLVTTEGNWKAGGMFMSHLDVPAAYLFQPGKHDLRPWLTNPLVNYVIASPADAGLEAVRRAGIGELGFTPAHRVGHWLIYRRPAALP